MVASFPFIFLHFIFLDLINNIFSMTISHQVNMRNEVKVLCHIKKQIPLTPSEVMFSWLFAQESHIEWLMSPTWASI